MGMTLTSLKTSSSLSFIPTQGTFPEYGGIDAENGLIVRAGNPNNGAEVVFRISKPILCCEGVGAGAVGKYGPWFPQAYHFSAREDVLFTSHVGDGSHVPTPLTQVWRSTDGSSYSEVLPEQEFFVGGSPGMLRHGGSWKGWTLYGKPDDGAFLNWHLPRLVIDSSAGGGAVTYSEWPNAIGPLAAAPRDASLTPSNGKFYGNCTVFGDPCRLPNGSLLVSVPIIENPPGALYTMYCFRSDEGPYGPWKRIGTICTPAQIAALGGISGNEGMDEGEICRVHTGDLIIVSRASGDDAPVWAKSANEGLTWTNPDHWYPAAESTYAGRVACRVRALTSPANLLVVAAGRGTMGWTFCTDGTGFAEAKRITFNLQAYHNLHTNVAHPQRAGEAGVFRKISDAYNSQTGYLAMREIAPGHLRTWYDQNEVGRNAQPNPVVTPNQIYRVDMQILSVTAGS